MSDIQKRSLVVAGDSMGKLLVAPSVRNGLEMQLIVGVEEDLVAILVDNGALERLSVFFGRLKGNNTDCLESFKRSVLVLLNGWRFVHLRALADFWKRPEPYCNSEA